MCYIFYAGNLPFANDVPVGSVLRFPTANYLLSVTLLKIFWRKLRRYVTS